MDYPRYVFTSPGPISTRFGTYGEKLVLGPADHEAALKVGFYDSVPDAIEAAIPKPKQSAKPAIVTPAETAGAAADTAAESSAGAPNLTLKL